MYNLQSNKTSIYILGLFSYKYLILYFSKCDLNTVIVLQTCYLLSNIFESCVVFILAAAAVVKVVVEKSTNY